MDPLALGAALAVLVAVVLGVVALAWASTRTGGTVARQRLSRVVGRSVIEESTAGSALREREGGELLGKEWAARTALELSRADLHLRVSEYVTLRIVLAVVLFALAFLLISSRTGATMTGLALAAMGYLGPAFFVSYRKRKRMAKLEAQLEETLTMVSNSLKAGFGLLQSLDLAAQQLDHPMSTELTHTLHEINVGSATEEALLALGERCSSYDLDIVITAIIIQRTVGGNLSEVLDTVTHMMRERGRIRGEIRTLTSQQRLTGYVLGVLPLAVMGLLFVVSNDYIMPLFTTAAGQVLLVTAGVMELFGILTIRRILAIEV